MSDYFDEKYLLQRLKSPWQKQNLSERALFSARSFYEESIIRVRDLNHQRWMYEETPMYEEGYLIGEILERYKKMIEHVTGVSSRIAYQDRSLPVILKKVEIVQKLYFEIYHLVRMMHEISRKYFAKSEFRQALLGREPDLLLDMKKPIIVKTKVETKKVDIPEAPAAAKPGEKPPGSLKPPSGGPDDHPEDYKGEGGAPPGGRQRGGSRGPGRGVIRQGGGGFGGAGGGVSDSEELDNMGGMMGGMGFDEVDPSVIQAYQTEKERLKREKRRRKKLKQQNEMRNKIEYLALIHDRNKSTRPYNKWWPLNYGWEVAYDW